MRVTIDPLLTKALIDEAKGADALPLLAYILRQLVADNRAGAHAHLSQEAFEAGGGIGGVLRQRLAAAQRAANATDETLRKLFVPRLATWDADANPPGAKRLVASDRDLLAGDRLALEPLANALVDERLLSRGGDVEGRATFEVAHETLLRQPPIADWLEEDREFLFWRNGLARARSEFEDNRRGLLMGRELELARGWRDDRAEADIPAADRAFIAESVRVDDAQRAEEERREQERRAAELAAAKAREEAAEAARMAAQEREAAAAESARAADELAAAAKRTRSNRHS